MLHSKFFQLWTIFLLTIIYCVAEDRYLYLPDPEKCKNRYQEAKYEGVNFFYSGHDPELKDLKVDWLDARNTCRERCMETVSFNIEKKFDFFKKYIEKNDIKFIWTSGRLCDFAGCEGRWDLLPKIIKAWLWTANQVQLPPTNKKPPDWSYQPWSRTGHRNISQPDDAEFFINQIHESCLAILNNMYNDSVAFHDVGCHHKTRFICEDSDELLEQAKTIELEKTTGKVAEDPEEKKIEKSAEKKEVKVERVRTETRKDPKVVNKVEKVTNARKVEKKVEKIEQPTPKPQSEYDDEYFYDDEKSAEKKEVKVEKVRTETRRKDPKVVNKVEKVTNARKVVKKVEKIEPSTPKPQSEYDDEYFYDDKEESTLKP